MKQKENRSVLIRSRTKKKEKKKTMEKEIGPFQSRVTTGAHCAPVAFPSFRFSSNRVCLRPKKEFERKKDTTFLKEEEEDNVKEEKKKGHNLFKGRGRGQRK